MYKYFDIFLLSRYKEYCEVWLVWSAAWLGWPLQRLLESRESRERQLQSRPLTASEARDDDIH